MRIGQQEHRLLDCLRQYPGISSGAVADYTHHDCRGGSIGEMRVSRMMDRLEEKGMIDGSNRLTDAGRTAVTLWGFPHHDG